MRIISKRSGGHILLALLATSASGSLFAQEPNQSDPNIVVNGVQPVEAPAMTAGPEIKGVISARNGDLPYFGL